MKTKQNVTACSTQCLPFGKSVVKWSSKTVRSQHDEKSYSQWKEKRFRMYL